MSLLKDLPDILEECRTEYQNWKEETFETTEIIVNSEEKSWWRNLLALGDNGDFMKFLLKYRNMAGKIQMIYIDPPFFSKANYDAVIRLDCGEEENKKEAVSVKHLAYEDNWEHGLGQYLKMLGIRLFFIRDLLTEEGTVWVHLDWHASHYVRLLMDEIFGENRFVNEIVWTYKSGGTSKRHFSRKHDTIFVYSKTKNYYFLPLKEKSYNRGMQPYRFKGVEEFQDETGWYTLVNMKDVWQIDMVGRTSSERTGYATQKPETLLERILACGSREGDICADFFCGSGTLAAVAQRMGRRWICCDNGSLAVSYTEKRLLSVQSRIAMERMEPEKSRNKTRGKLTVDAGKIKKGVSDTSLLVLKLVNYEPDFSGENLEEEGMKLFRKLAAEKPLCLLDYWSIDLSYDGKVFRPEIFIMKKKGKCETVYRHTEKEKEDLQGKICVKAADVFGNCAYCIIDRGTL